MKYFRLEETDYEEEYIQTHIFIKVPETELETKLFNALKEIVNNLKELDYEEEFINDFGDVADEEALSHFDFVKSNGELLQFEQSTIDILLQENKYIENKYCIVTLSEMILDFKAENVTEALSSLQNRHAFESLKIR